MSLIKIILNAKKGPQTVNLRPKTNIIPVKIDSAKVPRMGTEEFLNLINKPGGPHINKNKRKNETNIKNKLKQKDFSDF